MRLPDKISLPMTIMAAFTFLNFFFILKLYMIFESELIAGVLIKRYKRFFVDIKLKNKVITAHCPNTGSMMGLLKKGNKVWLAKSSDVKRKLKYTLQIIEINGEKVGVNTHLTNRIFYEALSDGKIIKLNKTDILFKEKI